MAAPGYDGWTDFAKRTGMWMARWAWPWIKPQNPTKTAALAVDGGGPDNSRFWIRLRVPVDRLLIASHESNQRPNKHYKES